MLSAEGLSSNLSAVSWNTANNALKTHTDTWYDNQLLLWSYKDYVLKQFLSHSFVLMDSIQVENVATNYFHCSLLNSIGLLRICWRKNTEMHKKQDL